MEKRTATVNKREEVLCKTQQKKECLINGVMEGYNYELEDYFYKDKNALKLFKSFKSLLYEAKKEAIQHISNDVLMNDLNMLKEFVDYEYNQYAKSFKEMVQNNEKAYGVNLNNLEHQNKEAVLEMIKSIRKEYENIVMEYDKKSHRIHELFERVLDNIGSVSGKKEAYNKVYYKYGDYKGKKLNFDITNYSGIRDYLYTIEEIITE